MAATAAASSPVADWHYRYRRIIDSYRQALILRDPAMCRTIDGKMEEWGEGWVCDDELPDMNVPRRSVTRRFVVSLRRHGDEENVINTTPE